MIRTWTLLLAVTLALAPLLQAREYKVFDIVGDSVGAGNNPDYADVKYGWAHMLFGQGGGVFPATRENTIRTLWPSITIHNSARPSSTSFDWAAQDSELFAQVEANQPDLVVFMIGGNDLFDFIDSNVFLWDEFRQNLNTIIDHLRGLPSKPDIIMMNYYDLLDGLSEELPPTARGYRLLSHWSEVGNTIIEEVATAKGCMLIDNYSDFLHRCYGVKVGDSNHIAPAYVDLDLFPEIDIHPNTQGYEAIYENVYEALQQLKQAPTNYTRDDADYNSDGEIDENDVLILRKRIQQKQDSYLELMQFARFWRAGG
jgi:lysophospholipase L1-like esterase